MMKLEQKSSTFHTHLTDPYHHLITQLRMPAGVPLCISVLVTHLTFTVRNTA